MSERKKIWTNLILFLVPFVLAMIALFMVKGNERFRYYFPRYNCMAHSGWLYDRLHFVKRDVDLAFIGTSRTMDAVNDLKLEQGLKEEGLDMKVTNMGYCRFGRNMHHMLIKEMVQKWNLKYLVLEINLKENWDGHIDFGYMAGNEEVLAPVMVFNDNYITDIRKSATARFDALRSNLFGVDMLPPIHDDWVYGHMKDTTHVDDALLDRLVEEGKHIKRMTGFPRWFRYQYSFRYLEKIFKLLEEEGCQVFFLYLPQYGVPDEPHELAYYEKRGTVLMPPKSVYWNRYYWKDGSHMNDYGATALTSWLKEEIAKSIRSRH